MSDQLLIRNPFQIQASPIGGMMEKMVAEMKVLELRSLMGELIEDKLLDLLGDPDQGLELRDSIRERLISQRQQVAAGERGQPFEDAVRQLGLG